MLNYLTSYAKTAHFFIDGSYSRSHGWIYGLFDLGAKPVAELTRVRQSDDGGSNCYWVDKLCHRGQGIRKNEPLLSRPTKVMKEEGVNSH